MTSSSPSGIAQLISAVDKLGINSHEPKMGKNRPNLNTLPPEVIGIIVKVFELEQKTGGPISDQWTKNLCGYSRICPSFTEFAREAVYSHLMFNSVEEVEHWLASESTIRESYKTKHLILHGSVNLASLDRVFILINQGQHVNELRCLNLGLS